MIHNAERLNNTPIVIIGGDHHNTLGVIRCLGRQKCNIKILFHSNKKKLSDIKCSHSKYAQGKSYLVSDDEQSIITWLYSNIQENRQIVFPCADLAAYVLDKNYNTLKEHYILPGFKDQPGKVLLLMDKFEQYLFAKNNNINVAETIKVNLNQYDLSRWNYYPCIIKPCVSAEGHKSDIEIAHSYEELLSLLCKLKNKLYTNVVIQEYLNYDKQYLSCGCVLNNHKHVISTLFEKVREADNGSTAFGKVVQIQDLCNLNNRILNALKKDNYSGEFDIEYFCVNGQYYLNEINFRHSGAGCLLIDNGVNTPYYWCLDNVDALPENIAIEIKHSSSFISEIADIYNLRNGNISFLKYLHAFLFAKSHTIFKLYDIPGTAAFYKELYNSIINRIRRRENEKVYYNN